MLDVRTYAPLQDEKKESSGRLLKWDEFLSFICAQINMFGFKLNL